MSQHWQETTESTINSLTSLSLALANDLLFLLQLHRRHELEVVCEIRKEQINVSKQIAANLNMSMEAIDKYAQLIEKYEKVEERVISSYTALEDALSKGKQQIDTVFQLILGKLNFVIHLQEWLVSQFFDIRAFMLYITLGISFFIATSFERTIPARFPLLLGTVCNYVVECVLVRYLHDERGSLLCGKVCEMEEVERYVKVERSVFLLIAGSVYLYSIVTYQNYQKRNNEMLKELKMKLKYIERTPYWIHKYFNRRKQLIADDKKSIKNDPNFPVNEYHTNDDIQTDPESQSGF
eukprot:TRINITY_DN6379_c0_g2_i3.p1 TRINITY_DN6379_c0_g2~~TRINITY_DN6379_c0_g2_i3.p1  ORF type:complete len:295 (-),score=51.97 TRINITY_DN6379_c0_g2_i3:62-946(-)